jgi:hypothetical protein
MSQFHWSYHYEEPRAYKLRSLFTLYYFVVAVKLETEFWEQRQKELTHKPDYKIGDDKAKNMFGMLPKTNINDLIRTTLSDLDRKTLESITVDAGKFGALKARMNKDLDECVKDTLASHEMTHANPKWYETFHVLVFQPGAGQRYKHESKKHYGTAVKPVIPSGPNNWQLTGTGKPLPTKFYEVRRDHDHKHVMEPTIVFEMRSGQLSAAGNDKFLENDVVGTVLKQVANLQKTVLGRAG